MPAVATIAIKLDAQTAELKKGFEKAAKATKSFSGQLKQSLGKGILKLASWVEVATKALALFKAGLASVLDTVHRAAELGDFADRIQISAERLQELQLVTEQFGGSAATMQTSLQRLTRRLAEAAEKGGPLSDSLERLGFSAREMAMLSPDQAFRQMADAVSMLATSGQQAALAMLAMDTEGVSLLETLRLGSDGLTEQMGVMAAHGVMSDEQVKRMQEADAALKVLSQEWQSFKDFLATELGPELKLIIETLIEMIKGLKTAARAWGEFFQYMGVYSPIPGLATASDYVRQRQAEIDSAGKVGLATRSEKLPDIKMAGEAIAKVIRQTIPAAGALTSSSVAGVSAVAAAKRRAEEQRNYERDMLEATDEMAASLASIDDSLDVEMVGLE